ncbi:hypothetical protein EI94DRAFT_641190 [Lactarius quietus]|nr:hypothetical protein EI94DRAFT_641190 [Lactarius quietus]
MYADDDVSDVHPSQLFQFINRTGVLNLAPFRRAEVDLGQISINLDSSQSDLRPSHLSLEFPWSIQVRPTRLLLVSASATLTTVRHLTMLYGYEGALYDIPEWIELFRLFPAVETLHFDEELVTIVDPLFDELIKETVTGVFPVLRFLSFVGQPTRSVCQFISTRQVSGFPVTLLRTGEESCGEARRRVRVPWSR